MNTNRFHINTENILHVRNRATYQQHEEARRESSVWHPKSDRNDSRNYSVPTYTHTHTTQTQSFFPLLEQLLFLFI